MKRLEAIFVIAVVIAVLIGGYYAITQAIGVNRVYGPEYLEKSGNGTDTAFVDFYFDSLVTMRNGLTISGGTVSLPASQITWTNLTDAVHDSTQKARFKYKSDTATAFRYGVPMVIKAGTNVTFNWTYSSTDSTILQINASTTGSAFPWKTGGGTYTTDTMVLTAQTPLVFRQNIQSGKADTADVYLTYGAGLAKDANDSLRLKDGFGLLIKTGDSLAVDTTQLKTALDVSYINDGAGEINNSNDVNLASATFFTNWVADSVAGIYLEQTSIHWTSQAFILPLFSIYDGVDDNMNIYYPVSVDSGATRINGCFKHTNSSGSADLVDTVSFSGTIAFVADTAVAIDSLTFNFRASSATVAVASIKPLLSRKRGDLSPELANYAGSATTTTGANAWKHVAITSGLGKVSSNEELFVTFVVTLDDGHNLYHDTPRVWVKGHN